MNKQNDDFSLDSVQAGNIWQKIWEKKGRRDIPFTEEARIQALMEINAWKGAIGNTSVQMMKNTVERIRRMLDIDERASLLDLGCGCGLIYYIMQPRPRHYLGIDYAKSSIEVAQQLGLPGSFVCCEAIDFPYTPNSFDAVLSLGVFLYFPSHDYAARVLERMVDAMKPGAKALILDIPDQATREAREQARQGNMTAEEYAQRYQGLPHLYFCKSWFVQQLDRLNCKTSFVDFFDENYTYDGLIFNVLFEKMA
ncbi:MAG: class I SAM-dependent methyltransferase [Bacteroidetes bacterium]|nr:MAG: class I SAM-dependent methyltransferase [Bacteroidota bacterium]